MLKKSLLRTPRYVKDKSWQFDGNFRQHLVFALFPQIDIALSSLSFSENDKKKLFRKKKIKKAFFLLRKNGWNVGSVWPARAAPGHWPTPIHFYLHALSLSFTPSLSLLRTLSPSLSHSFSLTLTPSLSLYSLSLSLSHTHLFPLSLFLCHTHFSLFTFSPSLFPSHDNLSHFLLSLFSPYSFPLLLTALAKVGIVLT